MLVMGLVLGPSSMVISIMGILLCKSIYLPCIMYYRSALLLFTCKQHILTGLCVSGQWTQLGYKISHTSLTVFEILEFKLKNKNNDDKKNYSSSVENGLLPFKGLFNPPPQFSRLGT